MPRYKDFILIVIYFLLTCYRSEGVSIYRFSEDYWKSKGNLPELVLEAKQVRKEYRKDDKMVIFIYEKAIDLGNYKYFQVELTADVGKELWWSWKSAKTGGNLYYPCEGTKLISDGETHSYTFMLVFPDRNNPIFDVTDAICFEVRGVEDGEGTINLKAIKFFPYKEAKPRQVTLGGVCMDVLWGEAIEVEKEVGENSRLVFYMGLYNPIIGSFRRKSRKEEWFSDGVRFKILIDDALKQEELFQTEIQPQKREGNRNWRRIELDISKYARKRVKFVLQIDMLQHAVSDYAVWGNPMIITYKERKPRENIPIFIISCDTLRPDHLLPYGYHLPTSPNLDAFAKDAVVFENSYTTQTFTPVAHMSLLTGRFPESHGLKKNIDLRSDVLTVQEILRKRDYLTAGFTGFLWWFLPSRGFSRGMDYFSVPDLEQGGAQDRRSVFDVHEEAKEWLKGVKDQNLFVFLHNYDIHSTAYKDLLYDAGEEAYKVFSRAYESPEIVYPENCQDVHAGTLFLQHAVSGDIVPTAEQVQYNRALYDDCVYKVDCALGDFFDFLKKENLYDSAFIAVVSDHGESLWEHELYGHENVYEESMRCVMMIKFPHQKYAGQRVKGKVVLEDIAPTILSLIGEQSNCTTDGIPIISLLDEGKETHAYVFSTDSGIDMKAIVKGNYKYFEDIKKGKRSLFDLTQPMAEYRNIIYSEPAIVKEMEQLFETQFGLKEEGWWLCFRNADSSFLAGNITVKCSVPILNIKTQSCVFRVQNDKLSSVELRGSIYMPSNIRNEKFAIIQIIPSKEKHELVIHLQKNVDWIYPSKYHVFQNNKEIVFHFSSDYKENENGYELIKDSMSNHIYFWALHYPSTDKDENLREEVPKELKETLENLGYLN